MFASIFHIIPFPSTLLSLLKIRLFDKSVQFVNSCKYLSYASITEQCVSIALGLWNIVSYCGVVFVEECDTVTWVEPVTATMYCVLYCVISLKQLTFCTLLKVLVSDLAHYSIAMFSV